MSTWAILASGPSMNQEVADYVRGKCRVAAVSDTYRLAPDADVLVSADRAWWDAHPKAREFKGIKIGCMPYWQAIHGVDLFPAPYGVNSGLLALMYAVHAGAKKVALLGLDLHSPGEHFFGRHPDKLKSTTQSRMDTFKRQFENYQPGGVEIYNCTPGSALTAYPHRELESVIA